MLISDGGKRFITMIPAAQLCGGGRGPLGGFQQVPHVAASAGVGEEDQDQPGEQVGGEGVTAQGPSPPEPGAQLVGLAEVIFSQPPVSSFEHMTGAFAFLQHTKRSSFFA